LIGDQFNKIGESRQLGRLSLRDILLMVQFSTYQCV
jgi:hypothetical protein